MLKKFLIGVSAVSLTAVFATAGFAQSDEQLRRQLQDARERIRQLEQMGGDVPPISDGGQCYSRVLIPPAPRTVSETITIAESRTETRIIPAVYDTVTERVLVEPERTVRRVIPAVTEVVTERVLVEPERIERRVIPAEFRTVTETVVVREASLEPVVQPAVYEEFTEQVLVREAYFTWQPSEPLFRASQSDAPNAAAFARANFSPSDLRETATGEILCRVEVPAEYRTVTRSRLVQPERIVYRTADGGFSDTPVEISGVTETVTREVETQPERVVEDVIPARYETVTRTVVSEPERVVEEVIPARFENVSRRVLVTPAREETVTVPPQTQEITRTVFDGSSSFGWREVLCEINATPEAIRTIQVALRDQGYNPGPIDGIFDSQTYNAMVAFQEANNLPTGNLTRMFVERLGVPWEPLTINFYGQPS
ncbi:peptidoglycan-binding domain-containing protein [Maricaulaceae bacterium MS644]